MSICKLLHEFILDMQLKFTVGQSSKALREQWGRIVAPAVDLPQESSTHPYQTKDKNAHLNSRKTILRIISPPMAHLIPPTNSLTLTIYHTLMLMTIHTHLVLLSTMQIPLLQSHLLINQIYIVLVVVAQPLPRLKYVPLN